MSGLGSLDTPQDEPEAAGTPKIQSAVPENAPKVRLPTIMEGVASPEEELKLPPSSCKREILKGSIVAETIDYRSFEMVSRTYK